MRRVGAWETLSRDLLNCKQIRPNRTEPAPKHVCHEIQSCICHISATEPDEGCIIHGGGPWPPRCDTCGRFLPWSVRQLEVENG